MYTGAYPYGIRGPAERHLHNDDWARTVYIDAMGGSTTDFGLPDSKKRELLKSGKRGALEYFEWYDSDNQKPNK